MNKSLKTNYSNYILIFSVLLKFHEFLINLSEEEINFLEQLLSTNYQNNDLTLNGDILYEYANNQNDLSEQSDILNYYNKFMKCAKKYGHLNQKPNERNKYSKTYLNKYISSSVDLLILNKNEDLNQVDTKHYSSMKPRKTLFRSQSMPDLNFNHQTNSFYNHINTKERKQFYRIKNESSSRSSSSTFPSTNSMESPFFNSYPSFSLITTSSSSSSLSNELDFMEKFREILKRSHKSSIARHRSNGYTFRPFSSNCPPATYVDMNEHSNQRSMTTTGVHSEQVSGVNFANFNALTLAPSNFSSNSNHIDFGEIILFYFRCQYF